MIARTLIGMLWMLGWIAGCVLAQGFWSTFATVITGGLWSWYLVLEKIMIAQGWV